MEIYSKNKYPANKLSNFAPHSFMFDGVAINSMEGFVQSLKFSNPETQKHVCQLVGIKAKSKGHNKKWWKDQTLYWNGKAYKRKSKEYEKLIGNAYIALTQQNAKFQRALLASNNAVFTHSIGRSKKPQTVLTKSEFTGELTRMRSLLQTNQIKTLE